MRTFYIFKINRDYYELTKNLEDNLYSTYLNMKLSTKNNIKLLYNEYFSITDDINKEALNNSIYNHMKDLDGYSLFKNIHTYNNYYTDEVSKLAVYNTFMLLKSNVNNPSFLLELSKIPYLFVIDFEKEDYFWLSNVIKIKAFKKI